MGNRGAFAYLTTERYNEVIGEYVPNQDIFNGTVHKSPADLRVVIKASAEMHAAWNDITPLARNEFICWIEDAKKPETRVHRILVAKDKLHRGLRRPCCWVGCPHREKNGK